MPRRTVTEPTNIYWLYDTRPEKVAVHGEAGEPFYCGKTVRTPQRRLSDHRSVAKRLPNSTKTCVRINVCGDFINTQVIEIVPTFADWCEREQFWIDQLRAINPECTNIAKGGSGAAGNVWTPEQRADLSKIRKGHRHSSYTCAKIGDTQIKNARSRATAKHYIARLDPQPGFAHLATLNHRQRFWYLYE